MRRAFALFVVVSALASACDSASAPRGSDLVVVTSTPVLADLARSILGERASVRSLVPPGADPHDFVVPDIETPLIEGADLLVVNGAGLERDFAEILDRATAAGVDVLVATSRLTSPARTPDGSVDPHFWLDPDQMAVVALALGDRMGDVDPDRADRYQREARRRSGELRALAGDMEETLDPVAEARRGLVTHHDFLRTFARRFGFTVLASVIPGYSSHAQPSAASRLAVIETIDDRGVCALFVPESADDTLARSVAGEADRDVGIVRLAADTLSGTGAGYDTAMRENALRVARALTGCR